MLAKNRDDRPKDAEALSLLDEMRSAPAHPRMDAIAGHSREHPETILEENWTFPEPVLTPVSLDENRETGKISGWVWGALAILALAAGCAAVWFIAFMPHSQQTQAEATQPGVVAPQLPGSNSNSNLSQTSDTQKPSPATKMDTAAETVAPANTPPLKPTQVDNHKPQSFPPPVVVPPIVVPPVVVPPVPQQPSLHEIAQQAVALYNQRQFSEAVPLLEKACAGGSGEACKDLGNLYHDGNGVGKDGQRAAALYSKACDERNSLACTNLGVMHHNGDSVARNDSRAAELYSKACDAGDALGCANLGNCYRDGRGVAQDDSQAANLYSRACNNGNGAGCSNLGNCYWFGRGVGKNAAQARQLLVKGCAMGNQWGCRRLKDLQ
jgi:hypothetical protein